MDVKEEFQRQLNVLKATFCDFCKVGDWESGAYLAFKSQLKFASLFFKITMGQNCEPILHEESDSNPLTKF
jgi:hypothetical protein